MNIKSLVILISILFVMLFVFSTKEINNGNQYNWKKLEFDNGILLKEMKNLLNQDFELWYPLSIDTIYGGFYSDINYKWQLQGRQDKMIVTQARHVWTVSTVTLFNKDSIKLFQVASHGLKFLRNVMWDKEHGGFYNLVNQRGEPYKENGQIIKQVYGNAFAVYGLAAYFKATKDTAALKLAIEVFNWIDKHSFDPNYGGYFQFLSEEGMPFYEGYRGTPPKDQNSSIHLLECFTELYGVWPNKLLGDRLSSLLHLIRDRMVTKKGYLQLFFKRDLTPVSYRDSSSSDRQKNYEFDHVSFGHDIETAYLLLEASNTLGIQNDTTTLRIAKKMVDHSFINGWDKKFGGLYDGGYYFAGQKEISIIKETKEWWAQAEALNSFLMMSELFPNDPLNYFEKFCLQWDYIKKYLIDNEYGGWYWGGIDKVPDNKFYPKGTIWKGNYHTSRALINCINRLSKKVK
ncbi:MAG: AGE family epimerase/isomerase [Ignavibacteriales bacterium]|nr:AGE family epimerase/isomerase [Ignavibacteriales bacterium]